MAPIGEPDSPTAIKRPFFIRQDDGVSVLIHRMRRISWGNCARDWTMIGRGIGWSARSVDNIIINSLRTLMDDSYWR